MADWVKKTNITDLHLGRYAALLGDAHQYLVISILMRLGFEVAHVTDRGLPYDVIVRAYTGRAKKTKFLRCQVRTIRDGRIRFVAGIRAGIDREYKSGVKEYKFTPKHNDLIIGVEPETLDLYLIPTCFLNKWGKSVAISKLQPLKNNFDILLNWNKKYLKKLNQKLPP